jgi:hypothetical protein
MAILDYQSNVFARVTDGVAIPVPLTPNRIQIADTGIFIPLGQAGYPNRVEILTTVGFRGDVGTGSILFRLFRDGNEIFYTREGFETGFEKFYTTTFQMIEINVTEAHHTYSVTAELLTGGTAATVIGPLTISALAIKTAF